MGPTGSDLAEQRVLTGFHPWQSTPGFNEQCSQALLNLLTEESAQGRQSLPSQRCSKANLLYLPLHEDLLEAPDSIIALPLWRDRSALAGHTPVSSVHGDLLSFWGFFCLFCFADILLWSLVSAHEIAETYVLSVHY